jgi:hypothetical protein
MKEWTGIAVVTKVLKHPVVRLDEGIEIRRFTIRAKMHAPAHKYSDDLYFVKILSPAEFGSLQPEPGTLMDHGEFELDVSEEVKVGDQLEISISATTSN